MAAGSEVPAPTGSAYGSDSYAEYLRRCRAIAGPHPGPRGDAFSLHDEITRCLSLS